MFVTCVDAGWAAAPLCQIVEFHKISKLNHRESELYQGGGSKSLSYATYRVTPPQLSFIKQPLWSLSNNFYSTETQPSEI